MSPRSFSRYGGPCFINNGFSNHDHDHKLGKAHEDIKPEYEGLVSVSIIGRIRSLFKSPRFKRQK